MIGDMSSAKLYILRGSTLSGTAAVITNDDPSTTNLWHKRLLKDCNMSKLSFCE